MIVDGTPFSHIFTRDDFRSRALARFLSFVERKLNVRVLRDERTSISPGFEEAAQLAALLRQHGIMRGFYPSLVFHDEPRTRQWGVVTGDGPEQHTGGAAAEDDSRALYTALAEALERYVWRDAEDYFIAPKRATVREMEKEVSYVSPSRFAGFSSEQRANPRLRLDEDTPFLWVRGTSLVTSKPTYVPAQVVSGSRAIRTFRGRTEPMIRPPITTGVAVWPEKSRAQLGGALEVIERDAYMITWLNQITPSRFPLDDIARNNPSLLRLVRACRRYKLEPYALRLVTDAPTYAVGVMLEDTSGTAPRFSLGLKAHYSLAQSIEGALLEALRARRAYRRHFAAGNTWDPTTPVNKIGHRDRLYYWGVPEHAEKLAFLLHGPVLPLKEEVWEKDTDKEYLARIATWCRERGYECISVSLGSSKMNPTSWSIERIIIPELQPTYLTEEQAQASGERLSDVPTRMGYIPRNEPFLAAPHPFS